MKANLSHFTSKCWMVSSAVTSLSIQSTIILFYLVSVKGKFIRWIDEQWFRSFVCSGNKWPFQLFCQLCWPTFIALFLDHNMLIASKTLTQSAIKSVLLPCLNLFETFACINIGMRKYIYISLFCFQLGKCEKGLKWYVYLMFFKASQPFCN